MFARCCGRGRAHAAKVVSVFFPARFFASGLASFDSSATVGHRMNHYAITAAVPRSILRCFAGATGFNGDLTGSGMVRKS